MVHVSHPTRVRNGCSHRQSFCESSGNSFLLTGSHNAGVIALSTTVWSAQPSEATFAEV